MGKDRISIGLLTSSTTHHLTMLFRDRNYYFEDGSCIFRAGNCLFNIHSSLLAQESLVFKKMFSLPQPESVEWNGTGRRSNGVEGGSDHNPVIFQDRVDSFRALCWGLYARPAEIRAQQDASKVDLKRLMLLAEISHKYDCTDLEKWAVDMLQSHWAANFSEALPYLTLTSRHMWTLEMLENFLLLSNKGDILDQRFMKQIEAQWLSFSFSQLQTKNSADLRRVLDFVDSLNNVRQKGLAYYRALRRIGITTTPPPALSDFAQMVGSSGAPDPLMCELTTEQSWRLMRGLWCLSSLRRHSLGNVAFNEPHTGCPSMSAHRYHWRNFWMGYDNVRGDLGLILEMAHERVNKRNEWGLPCWLELKAKIEEMIQIFEDNLSKYFMID